MTGTHLLQIGDMKRHKWNIDREESVDSLALEPNPELLTPVIIHD